MNRLANLMTLLSQMLNVILFDGSPDETVSGRSYRQGYLEGDLDWEKRRRRIDRLFFWEVNHCRQSHQKDVGFARMIAEREGWL